MKLKGYKRKIITGMICAAIAIAGTTSVALYYKDDDFKPDTYNNRSRNENQVVFPGEDVALDDGVSDESELWQQDENADRNLRSDERPSSSMLFQTMKVSDNKDVEQLGNTDDFAGQNPDGDTVYNIDNSGNNTGNNTNDILIPGDKTPGNDSGVDNGNSGNRGDGQGSDDGNHSGKDDDSSKPSNPSNPSNPDVPVTPSNPEDRDVDTTVPTLPRDDSIIPADPYPGDDEIKIDDLDDYKRYSLTVIGLLDADEITNQLYMGEYLNDRRILCSVLVYVYVDGEPKYRLTELNENFRIGDYPKQITEDTLAIDFYYRPGADYAWIKGTYVAQIRYSAKLLLQDWTSGEYVKQYMVPMEDNNIELFPLYSEMSTDTDRLFLGWSEEENGESVGPFYTVKQTGAKVMYPVSLTDLDDEYTMEWEKYSYYPYTSFSGKSLQCLKNYTGDGKNLCIPEGIEAVDLPVDIDWNTWDLIKQEYETMRIPQSMILLGATDGYNSLSQAAGYTFNVTKEYQVDEDNASYSSYQGMLLNKEQTCIYDIPDDMTSITVPETVTEIYFESGNKITQLHFNAKKPYKIDFENVQNAKIYVPSEQYLKYLAAWGKDPGKNGNILMAEDINQDDYVEDDIAIYSADGKTLIAVKKTAEGVLVVKDGVEKIAEGAMENSGDIDLLILPESIQTLEKNSLAAKAPEKIVFLGKTAPKVSSGTFSADSTIQVLTQAKASYEKAWSTVIKQDKLSICYKNYQYVVDGNGGFDYLDEEACADEAAGAILIKAPENLTYFDSNTAGDIKWKEIASEAFAKCENLYMVELPAEVKIVGKRAFAGCTSLQGVISYAEDSLEIRNQAFDGTDNLRFAAFHAKQLDCYDYRGNASLYGVCNGKGYEGVDRFSISYYLVDQEDGKLLYGDGADENNLPNGNCYVLGATDNVSGTITLKTNATEIASGVFENCKKEFTIKGFDHIIAIGDSAFENSGIAGELTFCNQLEYLGGSAFYGCKNITNVTIDGTTLDSNVYAQPLGNYAFAQCTGLLSVEFIGGGRFNLGDGLFSGCENLSTVTIAPTVGIKQVQSFVFADSRITDLELPESVTVFRYGAFYGCNELKSVTLNATVPPELIGYGFGSPFDFSGEALETGWLKVPEGYEQTYIDTWKYYMIGYTKEDEDFLTEEQLLEGENQVRWMLGLEQISSLPDDAAVENIPDAVLPDESSEEISSETDEENTKTDIGKTEEDALEEEITEEEEQ